MRESRLKAIFRSGRPAFGMGVFLGSPTIVEILGRAGWDWVYIDTQHSEIGPFDEALLQNMVRAAEVSGIAAIIRVAANDFTMIGKAFDAGADGVRIPLIESKEEAARAVKAAKYPPDGGRSICPYIRANQWDVSAGNLDEYCRTANRETYVEVAIETQTGLQNIEEIASVKGLDCIRIGLVDLSLSMGLAGRVDHPDVLKKVDEVVEICRKQGLVVGATVSPILSVEWAKKLISRGVRMVTYSVDEAIFGAQARKIIQDLTKE